MIEEKLVECLDHRLKYDENELKIIHHEISNEITETNKCEICIFERQDIPKVIELIEKM